MVLKNILKENPKSILIEDSCDQKGRPLFTSFLNCFSAKGFKVHLMNYDFLLSPPQQIDKFQNFSDDPLGYDSDSVASEKSLPLWIEQCTDQNVQYLIAIDSLSPLLLKLPVADIFSVIRRVNQTKNIHMIALVHRDVHSKETLHQLNYCFSCHLRIGTYANKPRCKGRLKSVGGKIIDSDELYDINPEGELTNIEEFQTEINNKLETVLTTAIPKSTFRLGLNQNEETARSKVVLPYIRKPNKLDDKGKIFYEAENDDWEDEDPDDDLEI